MDLTVADALRLGALRRARLTAGHSGLNRVIKHVSVIEVPDAYRWCRGGELWLTAFYTMKDDPAAQIRMLEEIDRQGSAALAICYPDRYVKDIPSSTIQKAEELGLPLLTLPDDVAYIDVISPVLEEIQARQVRKLQYALDIHNRLTRSILAGNGLHELVQITAHLVENPVLLLDNVGTLLASAAPQRPGHSQEQIETLLPHIQAPLSESMASRVQHMAEIPFGSGRARCLFQPVWLGSTCWGGLMVVEAARPIDEMTVIAVEQTCTGIALQLVQEQAATQTRQEQQRALLEELFAGPVLRLDDLLQRARALGWPLEHKRAVIVVKPDTCLSLVQATVVGESPAHITVGWGGAVAVLVDAGGAQGAGGVAALARRLADKITGNLPVQAEERICVGIGGTVANAGELWRSHKEATQALVLGRQFYGPGQVSHVDDLGTIYLLASCLERTEARRVVERVLDPILRHDRENGTQLLETLEALYDADGRPGKVAQELFLHRNTLHYRRHKIVELLGYDPFLGFRRLNVQLALMLRRIFM